MALMVRAFNNRDISWLQFNHRVLFEAADDTVPLLERFRFLSIYASNLDEFYRVRMPAISSAGAMLDADGIPVDKSSDMQRQVQAMINDQLEAFGSILRQQLLPQATRKGLHLYYNEPLPDWLAAQSQVFFFERILPFLQPVMLQPGSRAFFPENNQLYLLVRLRMKANPMVHAVLNIPARFSGRFFSIQQGGGNAVFFVDDIIRVHLPSVFRQYNIESACSFKITRDANLDIASETADGLAQQIEQQIKLRDFGFATRLLYDPGIPEAHLRFMLKLWGIQQASAVRGGRYHNLRDLAQLPAPGGDSWAYPAFSSSMPAALAGSMAVFDTIEKQDIGLHFPYQSYHPILRFFSEAAVDATVEKLYVTLYRIADDSKIANALISAALNGKEVKVFVELKARFDEDNNLKWSKKMKAAGVQIIYSIPDWKVHAKVALVKRRKNGMAFYTALLATGNFNENTARFYTDHAVLTADKNLTRELELLFAGLQSRTSPKLWPVKHFEHLLVAPFNLQKRFLDLIDQEIVHAKAGHEARIIIKLNNLEEEKMIQKLYDASEAGVKVDLVVRTICRLKAGVPGMSSRIRVFRIVDRFLEHGRLFWFANRGRPKYYAGSADWMSRNLYKRIEVCFPITDLAVQQSVDAQLAIMLQPHLKTMTLGGDGDNIPVEPADPSAGSVQQHLTTYFLTNQPTV